METKYFYGTSEEEFLNGQELVQKYPYSAMILAG